MTEKLFDSCLDDIKKCTKVWEFRKYLDDNASFHGKNKT